MNMNIDNNEKITRRKFVKGLSGATVCCACFSLNCSGPSKEISELEIEDGKGKVHLAAACGTYCGACPAYINKHGDGGKRFSSGPINDPIGRFVDMMGKLECDGCLSGGVLAAHCRTCNIRLCAASKQKDARCTDCGD